MSRIRSIKPEFWSSEQVMTCSPLARLLFIGIWNFCDDHGRFPASAKQLKVLIFGGDDITAEDVRRMLGELSSNGLLRFYEHSSKTYFYVTGWHHQKIDKRGKPKYPDPLKFADQSPSAPRAIVDQSGTDIDVDEEQYLASKGDTFREVVTLPRAGTSAHAHTRGEPADAGHDDRREVAR